MKEESDIKTFLLKEQLFDLFKSQLKKDFEGAGLNGDFADALPADFTLLCKELEQQLVSLSKKSSSALSSLLYRIDINERQLNSYQLKQRQESFEKVLAEVIVKRILQKVILRKKFGS
ncbi:MAG: hypothetical protein JNL60_17155 [Bacteroidia bacterium]|nr:hypothetical protein [Bacteroidia bacterium]